MVRRDLDPALWILCCDGQADRIWKGWDPAAARFGGKESLRKGRNGGHPSADPPNLDSMIP